MELDEFKSLWSKNMTTNPRTLISKNELDAVFSRVADKLSKLTKASKLWWNVSIFTIILLAVLFIGTAWLYLVYPDRLQSMAHAIPVMITLVVFIALIGRLYFIQARIFEVYASSSIGSALRQTIQRFSAWYKISLVAYTIILTPVLYFLTVAICYKFDMSLSLAMQLTLSIVLMILTLLLNHIHYKRTYFTWLNDLKRSLAELEEE